MIKQAVQGLAMLAACGVLLPVGTAQEAQRLARPFAMQEGADGKLTVSPDATVGNMVVDMFDGIGEKVVRFNGDRELLIKGYTAVMCNRQGAGAMAAHFAGNAIGAMNQEERAKLKSRDADSLSALSISVLAGLDGVAAEAIRADEAIGPGVYSHAIAGMSLALDRCQFFGLEGRL